jgi:hypothetical protein
MCTSEQRSAVTRSFVDLSTRHLHACIPRSRCQRTSRMTTKLAGHLDRVSLVTMKQAAAVSAAASWPEPSPLDVKSPRWPATPPTTGSRRRWGRRRGSWDRLAQSVAEADRASQVRYSPLVDAHGVSVSGSARTCRNGLGIPGFWLHVRVDSEWSKAAELWLTEFGWNELEREGFTQVDIDWFFDEPPARAVTAAIDCVQSALALAKMRHTGLDGLVTLPLAFADRLDRPAPDLAGLLSADWEYAPGRQVVGLYVLNPELLASETTEELRVPYGPGLLPEPLTAYYRCWRTDGEDWNEYDRAVYIRLNATT